MRSKISRRDFIKLTALSLGGLAFIPNLPTFDEFDLGELARVGTNQLSVYSQPDDQSRIVSQVYRDDLLHVYEEVNSGTPAYNPVWYHVWGGYVHRAHMQKVQVIYNAPVMSIRENGQLGEVTVPFTQAMRKISDSNWQPIYRLYYSTVHWIKGVEIGPDGQPWYILLDELEEINYDIPATHMRLIPDEEIAPISPEVPFQNKRIEVSLNNQTLTCYEYDKVVLQTTVSTGLPNGNPGSNGIPTITPAGQFNVEVKMPSKHMGNGNLAADIDAYELPGVPWDSFFTEKGHAFHGTYWHDNFGVPMSHGCVNMRTEEAKWLFRWTLPLAAAADINPRTLDKRGYGTTVIIKA